MSKIISKELKNIYKDMIDEILSDNGLTNECLLYYQNDSIEYCNNCIFDPITKTSSNVYNDSGPAPFTDYTICPVCMGMGTQRNNKKTKKIVLAVIFDTKYFLNFNTKVVNIPDGSIQTICSIAHANDILNSSAMSVVRIPNMFYERMSDINHVGLGDLDYMFVTWKKQ
jgi:hypothetical protein